MKGRVLGEDGERQALRTHRCTRGYLDMWRQEASFGHQQRPCEAAPRKAVHHRARDWERET